MESLDRAQESQSTLILDFYAKPSKDSERKEMRMDNEVLLRRSQASMLRLSQGPGIGMNMNPLTDHMSTSVKSRAEPVVEVLRRPLRLQELRGQRPRAQHASAPRDLRGPGALQRPPIRSGEAGAR